MVNTALIIVARHPELGKTKTRLARSIGDEQTLSLYTAFLTDLARRFAGSDYDLHWSYTPAEIDYAAFVSTLVPDNTVQMWYIPQQGTELGARLYHVFQQTFQKGYKKIILIGSDSPHIGKDIVDRANAALDEYDIVLGPAEDGGYYLIGMQQPHDVFSGIPMSTEIVAEMTIAAAEHQGLGVHLIDTLSDVDELSDLQHLAHVLQANPTLAPVTAVQLSTLKEYV